MKKLQQVAKRCELLYGENARPHVLLHGHVGSIDEWLAEPENLRRVVDGRFGVHILFKNSGDYVNGGDEVGIPPVDGRLEYVDPERIKRAVQFLHDLDDERIALFYLAPGAFHSAGLSAGQIVDEIVRQCREYGWDGVYLDGVTFGDNLHETVAALVRLRGEGVYVAAHASIHPHITKQGWIYGPSDRVGGYVDWFAVDLIQNIDVLVWGEGNDVTDDAAGMALLKRIASVPTAPELLFIWQPKADGPFGGKPEKHMPIGVKVLASGWTTPTKLGQFEEHRLPEYLKARVEYQRDPRAFVVRVAREW